MIIYERTDGEENVVVAINLGEEDYLLKLDIPCYDLLTNNKLQGKVK